MSFPSDDALSAENLTLIDCLTPQNIATLTDSGAVREASTKAGVSAPALAASAQGLRNAFDDALKIPVGEMFKAACLKFSVGLPEYTAPERDNAPASLVLAPIVIESSHHPTIAVTWGGANLVLRFDVELTLEIRGAQLLIEQDRVIGARTGSTLGKARVSYLGATPVELGSPEFSLPGELKFSRPVAIGQDEK